MADLSINDQNLIISELNSPEKKGGIIELQLSLWERLAEFKAFLQRKPYFNPNLRKVKRLLPNQPSFFISRESWQLLMDGNVRKPDGSIWNWVGEKYPNHEVFGFVFCVCEETDEFGGNIILFFRIRTILKSKTIENNSNKIIVDDFNFAFVDYLNKTANANKLKFVEETENLSFTLFTRHNINSSVIKVIDNTAKSFFTANLSDYTHGKIVINTNGNYFSKSRIVYILNESPKSMGSDIFIAVNDNHFTFQFKINPEYETNLPCPVPVVC